MISMMMTTMTNDDDKKKERGMLPIWIWEQYGHDIPTRLRTYLPTYLPVYWIPYDETQHKARRSHCTKGEENNSNQNSIYYWRSSGVQHGIARRNGHYLELESTEISRFGEIRMD